MSWDDFGAAIGPAVQAGFGAYQWMQNEEQEQQRDAWEKEKFAQQQVFKREDLAQESEIAKLKMANNLIMQGIKAETAIRVVDMKNISSETIAELKAAEDRYRTNTQAATAAGAQETQRYFGDTRNEVLREGITSRAATAREGFGVQREGIQQRARTATEGFGVQRELGQTRADTAEAARQSRDWAAGIRYDEDVYNDALDYIQGTQGVTNPYLTGAGAQPAAPQAPTRPTRPPPPSRPGRQFQGLFPPRGEAAPWPTQGLPAPSAPVTPEFAPGAAPTPVAPALPPPAPASRHRLQRRGRHRHRPRRRSRDRARLRRPRHRLRSRR